MLDSDRALEILHRCVTARDLTTYTLIPRLELTKIMYRSITLISSLLLSSLTSYILVYCLVTFTWCEYKWARASLQFS